jgi:heme A synthase
LAPVDDERLRRLATTTTVLVFCQIMVGATMRHTGAGLAIPDFPLSFGYIVPDHWSTGIALHFVHRIGAAVTACAAMMTAVDVRRRYHDSAELAVPARLLVMLVLLQITLGASVVVSKLSPWVSSIHVVVGALVLATSLVIALRSWQARFPGDLWINTPGRSCTREKDHQLSIRKLSHRYIRFRRSSPLPAGVHPLVPRREPET